LDQLATIHAERGGRDGPLMVLLHGMGCNAAVWDGLLPLLAAEWPGGWLVPDLRGHGRSPHRAPYGLGIHAADVAHIIDPEDEITVVGHSMGGGVAVALANDLFGVPVRRVIAFGYKVDWSDNEVARAAKIAATPPRVFDNRAAAVDRALQVAGLAELVEPSARVADLSVTATEGGYKLSTDPRVNVISVPDSVTLAGAARAPLHLFTGEHDAVGTAAGMAKLGEVTVLPGLGHSPHVEAPKAFWQAIACALEFA